jgi:hypothetical protein
VRVAYSLDWHLGAFPEPPAADFDVSVCAGDICEVGEPERAIQSVVEYACGKSAVAVAGNHDLYTSNPEDKRTNNDFIRLMRAEARRQDDAADDDIVHVLTADEPVCWIGNVRFVGLTLWSDWMLMPAEVWAAHARAIAGHWRSELEEYRRIRTERGIWTPYDAVAEHAREGDLNGRACQPARWADCCGDAPSADAGICRCLSRDDWHEVVVGARVLRIRCFASDARPTSSGSLDLRPPARAVRHPVRTHTRRN